jgi:sacsin
MLHAACLCCQLICAGVSPAALSSSYVLAANDQEAAVMVRFLGVQAPTAAQVYRTDVLPKLATLPRSVRDRAMLLLLRHLPDLQQQDRGFAQLLSQTPFLPSGKGELHVPGDLYDPRTPELVALLDPDACFPAPAFCGDVLGAAQEDQQQRGGSGGSFSNLAVLQQLGLRSSAQLDTLVAAARYVEKVAADGDEDMAVARSKVCSMSVCC